MLFPEVEGKNLDYKKFKLPIDLEGDLNIIIIPFQRWHQNLVDSWTEYLVSVSIDFPKVNFYEVPSLNKDYKLIRVMIDGGMRAGILNKSVRERTITIYIDKSKFKKALNIPNEDTIYLFLLNKFGEILWRSSGQYSESKAKELNIYLKENSN